MYINYNIIILLIFIIIVLISIIRDRSKKVEKYRKNWEYCKRLLDKEREKK